ncbi:MAG: hypothetical protein ACRBF0_16100 [Calditrichia bacterium]
MQILNRRKGRQADLQAVEGKKRQKFTGVVYYHGMGQQRHYEELSRLVEMLDRYDRSIGNTKFRKIQARMESSERTALGDVSYIKVGSSFRFYEMYWAPITADGSSAIKVLLWLLSHVITPIKMMLSAWRSRSRLRRAILYGIWEGERYSKNPTVENATFRRLLRLYAEFEKLDARRKFPRGKFKEFRTFVKEKSGKKSCGPLLNLATRWRRKVILSEIKNLFLIITLFLAMGLGLLGVLMLIGMLLKMGGMTIGGIGSGEMFEFRWTTFLGVLFLIGTFSGLAYFVKNYLGDVQLWTTYEQTNAKHQKRRAILNRGTEMLKHLLQHPDCERIVIVAHSLGTAIAMDSLLQVGRFNRVRNPEAPIKEPLALERIQHFITLGSPIDKIHYFFENYQSRYHRYVRVVEEIRGDLGAVPFAKNRKPNIHWINFWDQGDIVSGRLTSPSNGLLADLRIDNVHVANYSFPEPSQSHLRYYRHREIIKTLYEIVLYNKYSFQYAPFVEGKGYDYDSLFLGPGKFLGFVPIYRVMMTLLPWLVTASGLAYIFGPPEWLSLGLYSTTLASGGLILLSTLVSLIRGHYDSV